MILFGTGLSLPSLFLFRLLYKELQYASIPVGFKKFLLSLTGSIFIWFTFYLFDRRFVSGGTFNEFVWPLAYTITLFIFTFSLPFQTKA